MSLESKTVMVKWNGKWKKWYEDKGYLYTKNNDYFECKIEDVRTSSGTLVKVRCDYCGCIFESSYAKYNLIERDHVDKDACEQCVGKKLKEIIFIKNGGFKDTKICKDCGVEYPATTEYFTKDSGTYDGLNSLCKNCYTGKNNDNFNFDAWYSNKTDQFKNEWNYEDLKWIYDNYNDIAKQDILNKFPNKKYKTITNIIYQWNIRKIEKNDSWTQEDIEFLIENYPTMAQQELEERFKDRTWIAIKGKASKLKINRDEKTLSIINSNSHKGLKLSEETKIKMSKNRRGSKSSAWRGGVSPLHPAFRGMLYEWKLESFKKYNFKCAILGIWTKNLQVHHVNENFSDLIIKTLDELNLQICTTMKQYLETEIQNIYKKFLQLNFDSGLGIPLDKNIHRLFHKTYGVKNNTREQFDDFVTRLKNGEFSDFLKENNLKLII